MNRNCASPSCGSLAAGFSNHCTRHRKAITRHGHADQTAVTVHELAPYVRMVSTRMKANPTSPAWSILEGRWAAIVAHARSQLTAYGEGRVSIRHARLAAHQFLALADGVPPSLVIQTALAMFILAADRPHRFQSDKGFRHQLVRRVRGLIATNAGQYWDPKTRRTKRTYRDQPPRVVEVMASELIAAFGGAGMQLADLEKQKATRAQEEQRKLADALGALQ